MRWQELDEAPCAVARALSVVGDRWSLMVLRECFSRVRRFEVFQERLGISRSILRDRLNHLVDHNVLRREQYQTKPPRFEYRLTKKGLGLYPVFLSLMHWGNQYFEDDGGPPIVLTHKTCNHQFDPVMTCSECGEPVSALDVNPISGRPPGPRTRLEGAS